MTPRIPRVELPKAPPAAKLPGPAPRQVEGEVIPGMKNPVTIWEDPYDEGPIIGRVFKGERVRPRTGGRIGTGRGERGPFGSKEQGEIVIVGRRPAQPPISIGGVAVKRGKTVVITNPHPIPIPRAAIPRRPSPVPTPRPPPISVPRPPPLEKLPSPPSPLPSPSSSTPVPGPSNTPPLPSPTPSGARRTSSRKGSASRRVRSSLPSVLSAVLSRPRPSTRRSSLTLPTRSAASTLPGSTVPFTDPLTGLNTPGVPSVATATGSGGANYVPTSTSSCQANDRARRQRKRDACRRFKTIEVPAHTRRVCDD